MAWQSEGVHGIVGRARGSRARRAADFARNHFAGCQAHTHEASAVHMALESMCGSPLADLNPDAVIRDVLPKYGVHPGTARDSLDAIELRLAIEEEHRARDLAALALVRVANENAMKALLGPRADKSSWDPATIWVR